MTPLIGLLALSLLIAWCVRRPSSELFEEADSYYAAAERWERKAAELRAEADKLGFRERMRMSVDITEASWRRLECVETARALTRKALRRMPWKCL